MKFYSNQQSGFTLLELLVVIAIIGILASGVAAITGPGRDKATNTSIIKQMKEYQRVLDLHLASPFNRAPNNWLGLASNNNFCRVACFGDGLVNGGPDCLGNISQGGSHQVTYSDEVEAVLREAMSSLPRHEFEPYSGPAYSACVSPLGSGFQNNSDAGNIDPSEPGYLQRHYSLWYLLKGTGQDCVWGVVVESDFGNAGVATLCRYNAR